SWDPFQARVESVPSHRLALVGPTAARPERCAPAACSVRATRLARNAASLREAVPFPAALSRFDSAPSVSSERPSPRFHRSPTAVRHRLSTRQRRTVRQESQTTTTVPRVEPKLESIVTGGETQCPLERRALDRFPSLEFSK